MELIIESNDINDYLKVSTVVDFDNPLVKRIAEEIGTTELDEIERIKVIFEYVRDIIHHSADVKGKVVTCKASEVLKHG